MPEISLLAVLPAAPAAPGHAAGTTLGVAAVQPADPQADGSTHFLAQLKSALASLASAALPVINNAATTAPSQVLAGQTTPLMAQKPEDSKATADHQSEVMPELLAALGFIPVPPAFGPTMPTTPTTQPSRAADQTTPNYVPVASAAQLAAASIADGTPLPPIAASLPVNAQTPASPPSTAAIGDSDGPTVTAPSLASPSAAPAAARLTAAPLSTAADARRTAAADASQAADAASAPQPATPPASAVAVPHAATFPSSSPTQTPAEAAALAAALANASRTDPADGSAPRGQSQGPVQAAGATQAVATTALSTAIQTATQGAFGQSAGGGSGHSSDKRTATSLDSAAALDNNVSVDRSFAEVTSGAPTASTSGPVLPENVQASQVVSQIAHQADLFRQPGSKSIRIQLHPEDLGGVDVTLRYSAAGGIQLHINAEHAATGHLVQAGWTELRDALATQGINPDRMVMSITAPNDAGGLSFSSGNGSGRPDPGVDTFTQGQSSGQQQPHDGQPQQRTTRGWNPSVDPSPSLSDDGARVASAATARIDYRV